MEADETSTPVVIEKRSWPIGRVWRGEYPLRVSLWGLCVGVGVLMMVFWSSLGGTVSRPGSPLHAFAESIGQRNWMLLVGPLFSLCWLYLVIALVGVWRSAGRYEGWKMWCWLARIFAIFGFYGLGQLLVRFLISFLAAPS